MKPTDHELSIIADKWAKEMPENTGIRTAFANGFKAALSQTENLWVDVNEGLPELNTVVLVYQKTINKDWKVSISDYSKYGFTSYAGVTHWQLLPQAPIKNQPRNETDK